MAKKKQAEREHIMLEKQIEDVLAAITVLVNNDTAPWKEKKDLIRKAVGNGNDLDEFLLWFSDDEE